MKWSCRCIRILFRNGFVTYVTITHVSLFHRRTGRIKGNHLFLYWRTKKVRALTIHHEHQPPETTRHSISFDSH